MRNRLVWILLGLLVVGIVLHYGLGIKMSREDIHISARAEPLACIGGELVGEACSPGTFLPITNALVMTILVDLVLLLVIIFGARNMQLVPRGFQNLVEVVVEGFYNFALGIDRTERQQILPAPRHDLFLFLSRKHARAGTWSRQHRHMRARAACGRSCRAGSRGCLVFQAAWRLRRGQSSHPLAARSRRRPECDIRVRARGRVYDRVLWRTGAWLILLYPVL